PRGKEEVPTTSLALAAAAPRFTPMPTASPSSGQSGSAGPNAVDTLLCVVGLSVQSHEVAGGTTGKCLHFTTPYSLELGSTSSTTRNLVSSSASGSSGNCSIRTRPSRTCSRSVGSPP